MADQLKIEIDVAQAKAALDALNTSFKAFAQTASVVATTSGSAISRLNSEMSKLRGIDKSVLDSITQLNSAITNLNNGSFTNLSGALKSLASAEPAVRQTANATKLLGEAIQQIKTPEGIQRLSVSFGKAGDSAKQADAHVKAFHRNYIEGLNRINGLGSQADAHMKAFTAVQQQAAKAVSELGRELVNAGGFMAGLGVTAGNVVSAFNSIRASNLSVLDVISKMRAEFGALGTAMAAAAAAAVAFNVLSSVFQGLYGPILEVGNAFNSFRLAVDAVDGNGAGADTLAKLKDVAKQTSQDVLTLAKNYTGFRAATEASNITAQDSLNIYRQFSGALTALGADGVKTEKAFLALTQMFSKGKVQAEELRGQLGDALPGAFVFAAEAMGVTTSALDKMLKAGQVAADDLVPKLGKFLELKFGDAIAKQAESARGQLSQFSSAVNNLLGTIADGGALSGLAAGLQQVNAVLNSPAVVALAEAFGALLGIITNVGLSAMSGFAMGITAVIQGVTALYNGIVQLTGLDQIISLFEQGGSAMKVLSTVAQALGVVLGVLATAFAVNLVQGMAAYVVKTVAAIAQTTALTGALTALKVAAASNPFTAIAVGAAALGTALYAVYNQWGPFSQKVEETTSTFDKTKAAIENTSNVLKQLEADAASSASSIMGVATGFEEFAVAQTRAKDQIDLLKESLKAQDQAMKDSQETTEDIRRRQDEYASGIQQQIQELEASRNALKSQDASFKELGVSMGDNSTKTRELNEEIRDLRETLQSSAISTQDRLRSEAAWRDSMGDTKREIEAQIANIEKWGVALSSTAEPIAQQAKSLGYTKDAAAELAHNIQMLTRSESERADALRNEAAANQQKLDFLNQQIQKVKEARDAEIERMKASGESAADIERATLKYNEFLQSMSKTRDESLELTVAQNAYARALSEGISITQAVKDEITRMGEASGKAVDESDALAAAHDLMAGKVKGGAEALGEAGDKAKELGDKSGETGEKVKEVGDKAAEAGKGITTVGEALSLASEKIGEAHTRIATTAESFDMLAGASNSLSNSLPVVTPMIQQLTATVASSTEPMVAFQAEVTKLVAAFTNLTTSVPVVLSQFTNFFAVLPSAVEPLNMFVTSLGKIPEMATGLGEAQAAMQSLVEKTIELVPKMEQAAKQFDLFREAQDKTVQGYANANTAADGYMTQLDSVMSKISEVIGRLEDMKRAAEEALRAANAAAAAQTSGGGGNTQTGRYGGMSEALPQTQRISNMGVFDNAPQFRDGTPDTSRYVSKVPGGGIPSILHPNEAVVPLPKGRSIPVDLNLTGLPTQQSMPSLDLAPISEVAYSLEQLDRTMGHVVDSLSALAGTPQMPDINFAPVIEAPEVVVPEFEAGPVRASTTIYQSPDGLATQNGDQQNNNAQGRVSENRQTPIIVNVNVSTSDVDSFRRSEDQIARSLGDKINRAKRRTS